MTSLPNIWLNGLNISVPPKLASISDCSLRASFKLLLLYLELPLHVEQIQHNGIGLGQEIFTLIAKILRTTHL